MQAYGLLGAYLLSLSLLAVPLGTYVHRVMQGVPAPLFGVLRPVECALYRIAAIDPGAERVRVPPHVEIPHPEDAAEHRPDLIGIGGVDQRETMEGRERRLTGHAKRSEGCVFYDVIV